MKARRFTVVVSDRRSGVYRRFRFNLRPVITSTLAVIGLPMLIGLGLKWSATTEIEQLRATTMRLEVENRSFRAATGELTTQLQSLQMALGTLGDEAAVDAPTARAMENLPAIVKTRAAGGGSEPGLAARLFSPALRSPEDSFGLLRDLLVSLETRLQVVETDVARRRALAEATPSIWPTRGWLSDSYGRRRDPFTGEPDFHAGLDISADRGEPVVATASGRVSAAGRAGTYGNMVVVDHGFGLSTRYAHLDKCIVQPGAKVRRGDVLGYAGRTGRATGDHLHYEVLVHGRQLNPFQFILGQSRR
jgi:murein DD-endopeptidase MepM/ murein hydrolase activator NlpD